MRVIGVVGLNGSGKDTVVDYLHDRCSIPVVSSGDVAREIAEEEGVPATRENLHEISQRYIAENGPGYFMDRLADKIQEAGWAAAGITGIRTPQDVQTLQARFGSAFLLVHVRVNNPRVRYERMRQRDEERDPASYGEFLRQDREEQDLFQIDKTIRQADITIPNDGTLEALHRRVENLVIDDYLASLCPDA